MSRTRSGSSLRRLDLPAVMSGAEVRFTALMQKRLNRRTRFMIERALNYFPELQGKSITVGFTRVHLGSAVITQKRDRDPHLVIRLKVRNLTYQTIGHELTHLVQGLSLANRSALHERIPSGEAQCDIWTLARHELFCDDAPTYIKMPREMREHWPDYAVTVRRLCVSAIDKRGALRTYIRWLEAEIAALTRTAARGKPVQLTLPFIDNPVSLL
jgi:hypothetical protein